MLSPTPSSFTNANLKLCCVFMLRNHISLIFYIIECRITHIKVNETVMTSHHSVLQFTVLQFMANTICIHVYNVFLLNDVHIKQCTFRVVLINYFVMCLAATFS